LDAKFKPIFFFEKHTKLTHIGFVLPPNLHSRTNAHVLTRTQVSDGIIAPSYEPRALEILAAKKGGAFIVLQANADYTPPEVEYREVGGVVFAQRRNDRQLGAADFANAVTQRKVSVRGRLGVFGDVCLLFFIVFFVGVFRCGFLLRSPFCLYGLASVALNEN
jgi:hypothetical protein